MSTLAAAARPLGLRRGAAALALLAASVGLGCTLVAPASAGAQGVRPAQPLVVLLHDHVARAKPNAKAHRIETVAATRPLTGARTVLPVLARSGGNGSWVRARLPGRPNGHTGWIPTRRTRSSSTGWRLQVDLSKRRVTVSFDGRTVRGFRAVVGKPSTPTPRGSFFVEEALKLSSGEPGAPFALATSARSNALQEFDGGPGQIALHGTRYLSGALGSAASHGCIRLATSAITWLAGRIGAGVPLTIGR